MTRDKTYLIRPFVGPEELDAVREEFEKQFAAFGRSWYRRYICMTGLALGLNALYIEKEDEVIVTDCTHPATGDCMYQIGAEVPDTSLDERLQKAFDWFTTLGW